MDEDGVPASRGVSTIEWRYGVKLRKVVDALVDATNAIMVPIPQRRRLIDSIRVFAEYGGKQTTPTFINDVAVIHLQFPFDDAVVQPAGLATKFVPEATLAGDGFTNADQASLGNFNIAHPNLLQQVNGQLKFATDPKTGMFCQGDSGGPAFAGRLRGCKPHDLAGEERPHRVEGVISNNWLGNPSAAASTEAEQQSSACVNAKEMTLQDVTTDVARQWICNATGNQPVGCEAKRE
jgi:hypothetical protein